MRKKWTACFGTNVVAGCLGLDSPLWIGCSVDGCLAVAFGWTSIWIDPTATSSMTLMKKPAAKPDESNSLALVPVESSKRKGSESEAGSDGSKRAQSRPCRTTTSSPRKQNARSSPRLSFSNSSSFSPRRRSRTFGKEFENSRAAQGFGSEDWQEATKGNQLKKRKMLRGWIMDKQSTGKFFKEARTYVVKRNLLYDYAANGRPCSPALSPRPRPSKKSGSPRNRPFG